MNPKGMKSKEEEERLRYRTIIITPGVVGFKVRVGCSEAYFGGATQLLGALSKYLNDPQGTEREYLRDDQRMADPGWHVAVQEEANRTASRRATGTGLLAESTYGRDQERPEDAGLNIRPQQER